MQPAHLAQPLRRDAWSMFLALQREQPRSVFLDSAHGQGWSYLAAGDFPVVAPREGVFAALRDALSPEARAPGLPPFQGGLLGLLGYDVARELERLPSRAPDVLRVPPVWMLDVDAFLAVEHARGLVHALALPRDGEEAKQAELRAWGLLERAHGPVPELRGAPAGVRARSDAGPARYEDMVRAGQRFVAAGDTYQVNLAHRLSWEQRAEPLWLHDRLRQANPSPFAFYLDAGAWQLVSSSPELLLQVRGGQARTRPIAGTYPNEGDIAAQAERLRADPKERAEHTMLVDLERNDLGRVCRFGSVRVAEFMATEAYSHVVHLVSDVQGELRPGAGALDALAALFPGGTVTGAPKVRSMAIIEELEASRRAFYTGSVGWLGRTGDAEMNIVIRTMLCKDGQVHAPVGAGIVADSDPAREWRETLHKARALLLAAGAES
ncbi:MAG: anthranilate synthase component I family protein [Halobacteriales archaeon]|nr:anthranilate synthase component I family protein [Halobacteriales archaeon]